MYIEWGQDSDDLRLVASIRLDVSGVIEQGTIFVKSVDHDRAVLYMGSVKDAQAVFKAIRKRLGAGSVIITDKWVQRTVKNRWKGDD